METDRCELDRHTSCESTNTVLARKRKRVGFHFNAIDLFTVEVAEAISRNRTSDSGRKEKSVLPHLRLSSFSRGVNLSSTTTCAEQNDETHVRRRKREGYRTYADISLRRSVFMNATRFSGTVFSIEFSFKYTDLCTKHEREREKRKHTQMEITEKYFGIILLHHHFECFERRK